MNFPEPSGSSPALNPPGKTNIWEFLRSLHIWSTDSAKWFCVKFLSKVIFASAPFSLNLLYISYSELVPGKAAITTLGLAIVIDDLYIFFSDILFLIS